MIGMGGGQTLRLNVVAFPANPCSATIGFLNSNGTLVASKVVTLIPGQTALQADLLDLSAASQGIAAGQRAEFQPTVTLGSPIDDMTPVCGMSVEVFDSTTAFSLVTAPPPGPAMPNVSPVFGMAGIALGQTLRLNVVAFPPDPCYATIGFLNNQGQPVPGAMAVSLAPGQAGLIDLHAASLGLKLGQRAELQPVVMVTTANGTSACQASAEVIDTLSGGTETWFPPVPCLTSCAVP
ncbi:MAG TPA: hypothetical protein VK419_01245 [Bryobacteraceae bacterium]|nr:hypothetical protein [Bryobacteraceae bacterium]